MTVRSITTSDLRELARESFNDDERRISGAEEQSLGAFRGVGFAILIEVALVLLGCVGWQVWRFVR